MLPDNAYGAVVQAAFQQEVPRRGGRVVVLEKYPLDPSKIAEPVHTDGAGGGRSRQHLHSRRRRRGAAGGAGAGRRPRQPASALQLLGTGLWDDPRIFSDQLLQGGLYAAPESAGFRNFSARYRARFGQDPVRTATLAYDAVALVAALVKTQGAQRFRKRC